MGFKGGITEMYKNPCMNIPNLCYLYALSYFRLWIYEMFDYSNAESFSLSRAMEMIFEVRCKKTILIPKAYLKAFLIIVEKDSEMDR